MKMECVAFIKNVLSQNQELYLEVFKFNLWIQTRVLDYDSHIEIPIQIEPKFKRIARFCLKKSKLLSSLLRYGENNKKKDTFDVL